MAMQTCEVLSILATKYPPPFWAFIREFRNATAFDATRSADALAVGLYRSRGQVIIGFEKKIYRSDWLRELKRPEKAEPIAQFCDYFHVVVTDLSIVQVDELPQPWGLIVVDQVKRKVHQAKKAEQLKAAAITRPFMCAIIKQAMDVAQMPAVEALKEAREAGYKEGFERAEGQRPFELKELHKLKEQIAAFEQASGVKLDSWSDGRKIGEAVFAVQKLMGGNYSMQQHIEDAQKTLETAAQDCSVSLRILQSLFPAEAEAEAA